MKYNPRLKAEVERFQDYVIIVEGEKDIKALRALGFSKVYSIHLTGVPLKERAAEIASSIDKRDKVCILTDFDKKGKALYMLLKTIFQELGVRLDSTLRGLLLVAGLSHIEGLNTFMDKANNKIWEKKHWEVR